MLDVCRIVNHNFMVPPSKSVTTSTKQLTEELMVTCKVKGQQLTIEMAWTEAKDKYYSHQFDLQIFFQNLASTWINEAQKVQKESLAFIPCSRNWILHLAKGQQDLMRCQCILKWIKKKFPTKIKFTSLSQDQNFVFYCFHRFKV